MALIGGEALAFARPMLDRPDVAHAHGDTQMRFGFTLEVPLPATDGFPGRALRIVACNDRGDCAELHWAVARAGVESASDEIFAPEKIPAA